LNLLFGTEYFVGLRIVNLTFRPYLTMASSPVNSGTAQVVQPSVNGQESKPDNGVGVETAYSDEIQPIHATSAPTGKSKSFFPSHPVVVLFP